MYSFSFLVVSLFWPSRLCNVHFTNEMKKKNFIILSTLVLSGCLPNFFCLPSWLASVLFVIPCLFLLWVVVYQISCICCLIRCQCCLKVHDHRRVDLHFLFMTVGLFEAIWVRRFLLVLELGDPNFSLLLKKSISPRPVLSSLLATEDFW